MRFLITILFALPAALSAQTFPNEIWHEGKAVLLEGDTLSGWIKYDMHKDIVQHRYSTEGTITTVTPRSLAFFEIFDKTANQYRQFYVLPYNVRANYKAPIIFELVFQGKALTLLNREKVEYQVTSYPYAVSGTYSRLVLVFTHYFLWPDGHIEEFSGNKKDLLWKMKKKSSQMKKFLKVNRIKTDRRSDLVKAVSYYNSLFEKPETRSN
ncbi:MAG: hypothetical protein AAF149_19825 [Bacteroidota bacterium]